MYSVVYPRSPLLVEVGGGIDGCAYQFGTAQQGVGRYSICWAWDTAHPEYTHHLVRVGTFYMAGPRTLDVRCTLGQPCTFTVVGVAESARSDILHHF